MDAFNGDFCQCDHSIQNLMVSIVTYKNFYSRPYKIETMGVCLVACSYGQFTGLFVFGAFRKVASVLAFVG